MLALHRLIRVQRRSARVSSNAGSATEQLLSEAKISFGHVRIPQEVVAVMISPCIGTLIGTLTPCLHFAASCTGCMSSAGLLSSCSHGQVLRPTHVRMDSTSLQMRLANLVFVQHMQQLFSVQIRRVGMHSVLNASRSWLGPASACCTPRESRLGVSFSCWAPAWDGAAWRQLLYRLDSARPWVRNRLPDEEVQVLWLHLLNVSTGCQNPSLSILSSCRSSHRRNGPR